MRISPEGSCWKAVMQASGAQDCVGVREGEEDVILPAATACPLDVTYMERQSAGVIKETIQNGHEFQATLLINDIVVVLKVLSSIMS